MNHGCPTVPTDDDKLPGPPPTVSPPKAFRFADGRVYPEDWADFEPFSPEEIAAMGPPVVLSKEDLVKLARPNGEPPALNGYSPEPAKRTFINFVPVEWTPIQDAFTRMIAVLGKSFVAERDLRSDLLSGQLPAAVRWCTFEDEWEGCEQLAPSVWKFVYIGACAWPHDETIEVYPGPRRLKQHPGRLWRGHTLDFYIERAGLEKRYPLPGDMIATPATPIAAKPELPRRPTYITKHQWIAITAEMSRLQRDRNFASDSELAAAALQWCEDTFDCAPSDGEMRGAAKTVRTALLK
jgi:hypothetical protein